MTLEQFGRALGLIFMVLTVFGLPWLFMGFIAYDWNVADWNSGMRLILVVIAAVFGTLWRVGSVRTVAERLW